jgi:purine nucleoside phosphorylase
MFGLQEAAESVASRAMPIAIITGSGTHSLPGFDELEPLRLETPFGPAAVTRGMYGGVDALHFSRHGAGHVRLSSHVTHRANIWALKELGATTVIGCTVCGAVDPNLQLGGLLVFDDLHFMSNRLPDGTLCTFFTEPGDPARGHWILHRGPFSEGVRRELLDAAARTGHTAHDGGTYGHVDGPRFNTPTEIAQLASCGVAAVSQTGGPEAVLCGELEIPFALIGFITDHANGVAPGEPTSVAKLIELLERSATVFADVLRGALEQLAAGEPVAAGTVYRIEPA